MASASVDVDEIDISTRVPSSSGVAGAMVLPLPRGRTDRPFKVTSQTNFLKKCTANEKIEIGTFLGVFSALNFLEKSNELWIKRPKNRSTFGGAIVKQALSPIAETMSGAVAYSGANNIFTVNINLGKKIRTGTVLTFTNSGGGLPAPLATSTKYFAVKISDTQFKVSANLANALAETPTVITITDSGTGTHSVGITENLLAGIITSEFVTSEDTFSVPINLGKVLQTGTELIASSGGTIPTGLTNNTNYFVIKISNTQIKLATSQANALLGTAINITGATTKEVNVLVKTNNEINLVTNFTINTTDSQIVVPAQLGSIVSTGDAVILDTEGSLTGTGITAGTTYYAVKVSDTEFKIATTKDNALLGTPITITLATTGTVKHYVTKLVGALDLETYNFDNTNELMVIRAKDEGNWSLKSSSGSVQWTIEDYTNKETNSFKIKVFKTSNLSVPVEEFVCSRVLTKENGDGKNIYVENVMKSSEYLEVIDNTSIAETVMPVFNSTPIGLSGGDNGDVVTDSVMITALQELANPDEINMTVFMDGGWATPAYAQAITTLCENRGDCFGILSIPISAEQDSDFINAIIDYRRSTNISSSYVGFYSSHLKINDRFNNREIYVSPDGFVGAIVSATADNYELWYPPAGWKRGTLKVLEALIKFEKGQRDSLADEGINPIRSKPNRGVAVFGQKTALNRPSALDRVNVRFLLIKIEPANADALEDFEFELNDVSIRSDVESIIKGYMEGIKAKKGCYDYLVVCDDSNNSDADLDNYKLTAWLFVKPTKSAEFIKLAVIITRTGTDFSVALQLI